MRWTRMVLTAAVAFFAVTPAARATDYVVTGLADNAGICEGTTCTSVRQAINTANLDADADTISIDVEGTVQLTNGVLQVTEPVTITGAGAHLTTIAADQDGGRVLEISTATTSLNDLALQGGLADGLNNGPHGGSLMAQSSTVTLNRVRVHGGTAQSGGGIANRNGTMTINESLIDNNTGGAGGGGDGGGIINFGGDGFGPASLTITNSTIAFNTARMAGALISYGGTQDVVTTTGVTIAQNRAGDRWSEGGGGIHIGPGTTWSAQATLISDNFHDQTVSNCTGADAASNGWNVENFDECGFTQEVDRRNVGDVRLDTVLDANGGPTSTMKLLAGSPALDVRTAGCTGVDQRGVARPQGAGCDAGAFESELGALPLTITAPVSDTYTNATHVDFAGTATAGSGVDLYLGDAVVAEIGADDQGAWSADDVALPDTDGQYTYRAESTGATPATVRLFVDRTQPSPTIDSGPPEVTNRSEVTFTYSLEEEEPVTFECVLSGPGLDAEPRPCPASGQTYTGLVDGEYTFEVWATDRAGNTNGGTVDFSFVVNRGLVVTPEVSEAVTEPTAATLTFSTAAERSFTCRLEGPGRDASFTACSSPQRYVDLAAGGYRFTVRSTDALGNFADSVPREFSIAGPLQTQPTPSPTPLPTATPSPTPAPRPEKGEKVVIRPTAGKVLVQQPGSKEFVELKSLDDIPLGATIDTRKGRIQLRFESEPGKVQTGVFYGGIFRIRQIGKILELRLTEALAACPKKKGKASAAKSKKKAKKRKLWGDGKGAFRTRGRYSAATVRGTKWLVEDSCAGTLTRVASGVVAVRAGKKTILLRAGKRYLAKPR